MTALKSIMIFTRGLRALSAIFTISSLAGSLLSGPSRVWVGSVNSDMTDLSERKGKAFGLPELVKVD